jgi:hypothetical protein
LLRAVAPRARGPSSQAVTCAQRYYVSAALSTEVLVSVSYMLHEYQPRATAATVLPFVRPNHPGHSGQGLVDLRMHAGKADASVEFLTRCTNGPRHATSENLRENAGIFVGRSFSYDINTVNRVRLQPLKYRCCSSHTGSQPATYKNRRDAPPANSKVSDPSS